MIYQADKNRYGKMVYRRCGDSGVMLPAVSLGLWHNFGSVDSFENMKALCFTAFDNGITHFDLANNYGPVPGSAEENFGRIMESDLRPYRDELFISTKAGYEMWEGVYGNWGSKKHMIASLDQSLKRMKLDYVDVFYHHRMDPETPLEESMMALDTAVKSGKALYAGISNYDRPAMEKAMAIMKELKCPFILNQRKYSLYNRTIEEDGVKASAGENGCGIIAFSPLAQGLLTTKYLNGIPEDSRIMRDGRFLKASEVTPEVLERTRSLNELAAERGETLPQMALAWVLKDKEVASVIIGASRPEQISENCRLIESKPFTEEELSLIEKICSNR